MPRGVVRRSARGFVLTCLVLTLVSGRLVNANEDLVRVRLLSQPMEPLYQGFVTALTNDLPRVARGQAVLVDANPTTVQPNWDLTIAVGLPACREAARSPPDLPLVCAMVPRLAVEPLMTRRAKMTALYLDQPVDRLVALTQMALPDTHRVGFLYSSALRSWVVPLHQASTRQGLSLTAVEVTVEDNLVTVLRQHLADMDVLLALPDPLVFRSENIYALLLTTYRANVPVIGFSEAYVTAGALTGVYSTPAQLGRETAEIAAVYAAHRRLPPPRYPRSFTVSVNRQVANSLQRQVPNEDDLRARLENRERELPP